MDEKYQNKYRIQSARLQNWDYGSNASYFITICTKNRDHFFGEIRNNEMHLTNTGWLAETYWLKIPTHFPFIELGNFTVMPNHVHGILIMDKQENQTGNNNSNDKSPGQLRFQNQGNETISFIVGSYKSIVSKKGIFQILHLTGNPVSTITSSVMQILLNGFNNILPPIL